MEWILWSILTLLDGTAKIQKLDRFNTQEQCQVISRGVLVGMTQDMQAHYGPEFKQLVLKCQLAGKEA
jgi:hypothetical protein